MEAAIVDGRGELIDPRRRTAELVELAGDRIAFARNGRVAIHELGREQRSVAAIDEVIRTRGDWKIVDGGLVPSHDLVERKIEDKPTTLDFDYDAISGSVSKPELQFELTGTGIAGQIVDAKRAADAGKRREVRMLVAAIPDAPAVSGHLLYVLAWLRHDLGDELAAFKTLRAAASAPGWKAAETKTLARELARFAAAADISFDDTVAAVRAASRLASIELLTLLDEIYREAGELTLEQRVLAELVPLVPRDRLAPLEVRQARHALDAGDSRALRRLAVSAIKHVGSLAEAQRAIARKDVIDLASRAIRYHDSTKDESYLRAAHHILRAVLAIIPDGDPARAQVERSLSESEQRIASGINAMGAIQRAPIREVVVTRHAQVRRCYERSLVADPKLTGTISFTFVISGQKPTKVSISASSISDAKLGACVQRELEKLTFPRARYAGLLIVNYPLLFQLDQ
jgi:hypothetical protein